MKIKDKVVVVTGGANGIGRALCLRFASEGAKAILVADIDGAAAGQLVNEINANEITAKEIDAEGFEVDVANESDILRVVNHAEEKYGCIDLFCSNAGIMIKGGAEVPDELWQRIWEVNVRAHIYAARAVLPGMLARGQGYFLQTVSAAGLLSQPGSAPYSVTKHAALGFAEWLAITHYDQGIRVSALCPQGVRTSMLNGASETGVGALLRETAIEPDEVADDVMKGLEAEQFLILPHPEVAEYFQRKAADCERWLRGMRRLQASGDAF